MKITSNVDLGSTYRDTVTGFTGRASGVWVTVTSQRVCLETLVDGKVADEWFDVGRIEQASA